MTEATGTFAEAVLDRADAFTRFFVREHVRLIEMLTSLAGSREAAEEVAQEAFTRVWTHWDRVREVEEPAGYLYRVATNVLRSRFRHDEVVLACRVGAFDERDPTAVVDDCEELHTLLETLTERERAAIVLTGMLGYSSAEAGELLGIESSTVRVLTMRARTTMRAHRTNAG